MIYCIVVICLAFLWMLKETDYLRLRMYAGEICADGDCCQWKFKDEWVTDEMKSELIRGWTNLPKELRAKFETGIQSPMCGWGYAWQYHDVKIDCKVELITEHSKITMQTESLNVIKDCMKVYRNPYVKVNLNHCKADTQ